MPQGEEKLKWRVPVQFLRTAQACSRAMALLACGPLAPPFSPLAVNEASAYAWVVWHGACVVWERVAGAVRAGGVGGRGVLFGSCAVLVAGDLRSALAIA